MSASRLFARAAWLEKRASALRSVRLDHAQERVPELVGEAHDEDPAVGAREGLHRRHREVGAARLALGHVALVEVPDRGVAQLVKRDVEEAGVHVAALAGGTRLDERGQQAHHRGKPRHVVDHRGRADPRGRAVGLAREVHEAGFGLHQIIEPARGAIVVAPQAEVTQTIAGFSFESAA